MILVMTSTPGGCWYYRIAQPYAGNATFLLPKDLESEWLVEELKKKPTIVCRTNHAKAIKTFDKFFPDCKIVLDLDDDVFDVSPYNDNYEFFGTKEVKHGSEWLWKNGENGFDANRNQIELDHIQALINRADILTVSTPRLAKKFKHPNIYINYNGINFEEWHRIEVKRNEFRLGWSGSPSHYVDWALIQDELAELMNKHKDVKLVIAGAKFDGTVKNIDPKRIEYWPWVLPEAHPYRSAVMGLDMAVIPLADNNFNRGRSCVKWYEFSALGVPVIASNVPPYSDEMPKDQLFDKLLPTFEKYYHNKELRQETADKQYQWVKMHRNQTTLSKALLSYIQP